MNQVDATTVLRVADRVYKSDGTLFGIIKSLTATTITFNTVLADVANDDFLFSFGQKVLDSESTQKSLALRDNIDLIPYIGIACGAGAAEALDVSYCAINRVIFE